MSGPSAPRPCRWPTVRALVAYQALWLVAVLAAARLPAATAALVCVPALVLCLRVHPPARVARALPAAAVGYASDAGALAGGVLVFSGGTLAGGVLPPLWLAALWLGFAVSFPVLLGWLRAHPWLTAALGAVGGTLSYATALRLGAAGTPDWTLFAGVMAPLWAARLALLRWWWLRAPAVPPTVLSTRRVKEYPA